MRVRKYRGIKRYIAVATEGLLHALAVTAVNVTDRKDAVLTFEHNKDELPEVKSILCDGDYSGKPFVDVERSFGRRTNGTSSQAQ